METEVLTGPDLKKMLDYGLVRLTDRYKEVDSLNVFPVPDGDTGTNMYLTLAAAVKEVETLNDICSIDAVAEAVSRGALMGARGNSGVILSQLFRGLARGLKNMDKASVKAFVQALDEGVKVAYTAVIKPVEGTILTVAREAAAEALKAARKNLPVKEILKAVCLAAEETLNRTPEMLPVLQEAGVVDAGGMGWLIILQGFRSGLEKGQDTVIEKTGTDYSRPAGERLTNMVEGCLRYPYCTEVLIKARDSELNCLKEILERLGDSLLVVETEEFIKVHIHSAHPGEVLENCLKYGSLTDIKINNMNEQMAKAASPKTDKPYGIVSVAVGEGIKKIMESLGADKVIYGGQTMNPSTQELLRAVEEIDAGTVIILPNNGNILLTAKQVGNLSNKQIRVIPTRTIPQGLAALLAIPPGTGIKEIIQSMADSFNHVKTGEVTYAVRDTKIDGKEIKKGSIIGLYDDKIVETGSEVPTVVLGLLKKMITPEDEVCTLYYGEAVTGPEAENLAVTLAEQFSHLEFEFYAGGQPLYYYIISVE